MNKPELTRCNRLLDDGFSLLTVGDNKQPNLKWGQYQNEQIDKETFAKYYNWEITQGVGIITGYNYLECIDVDLKVFSTTKERKDFWSEFLQILDDNILDFKDKFVIYRTKNEGYHILYKSKRVQGNSKIASLKGHKEAIIESRGKGGYVFIYDGNNVTNKTYSDIQFVSDADREMIWETARIYNHVEQVIEQPKKELSKNFQSNLPPWEDFNQKNTVLDIVSDELPIIRQTSDKYIVKRHGATSPHSGYIFKDTGFMYLFSTGTRYPAEKVITPFVAYVYKNHHGDFSQAAKELYKDGYGERVKPIKPEPKEQIKIPENDLNFPIEIFPESLQEYIILCNKTLNSSIDYMGCSLLWVLSIIIGNSIQVEVKKGWRESVNLWMCLVGQAGIGKTPSISNITFPLMKVNSREVKRFIKDKEKYDAYNALDKQEQQVQERVHKPVKSQFIVNDITLEALVDLHEENKNGIGVLKDELAGWLKDMNKYRQGSDLEHWLSSWSGKEINLNRKTAKSSFVERAFIPVMGGIQPDILGSFYTSENKQNGFIDRMLFSFPELKVEPYNEDEMNTEYLAWYEEYIIRFYEIIKGRIIQNEEGEIEPFTATLSDEAKREWIRIFNEITDKQNSQEENEYMKSMLPKQKSYIPRYALLIEAIRNYDGEVKDSNSISKSSMLAAEKLSKYFIAMAKKIKADNVETADAKKVLKKNQDKTTGEQIKDLIEANPNMNKQKIADLLNVSRQTVYNHLKNKI